VSQGQPGRRNAEILADLLGEVVVDLGMAGHRRRLAGGAIDVDRMIGAFAQEFAPMLFEVPNQCAALHALTLKGPPHPLPDMPDTHVRELALWSFARFGRRGPFGTKTDVKHFAVVRRVDGGCRLSLGTEV
jgi:hypothetical protein